MWKQSFYFLFFCFLCLYNKKKGKVEETKMLKGEEKQKIMNVFYPIFKEFIKEASYASK